jgi:Fe-Mn family superoxide dismutase
MTYSMKPLGCDPQHVKGMSEKLIVSHYENNYGGAVKRLNLIVEQLAGLDFNTTPGFLINGLKREELIASNSMILHELFFDGLGDESAPGKELSAALTRDFGSVERWRAEFIAMGKALAGGSGWVLLSWSPRDRRLVNQWAADHCHTLAGGQPIVALDMYEHSYHIDFGANAKAYVEAFMRNTDWKSVEARYDDASAVQPPRPLEQKEFGDLPGVGVEEVKAMMDTGQPLQLIDARPKFYVSRTQDIIEGAVWKDPERVQEWAGELSKTDPVVVFCVYGFHVGCRTAVALRDAGFDARYMKGGHSAWKAIGGPVRMHA